MHDGVGNTVGNKVTFALILKCMSCISHVVELMWQKVAHRVGWHTLTLPPNFWSKTNDFPPQNLSTANPAYASYCLVNHYSHSLFCRPPVDPVLRVTQTWSCYPSWCLDPAQWGSLNTPYWIMLKSAEKGPRRGTEWPSSPDWGRTGRGNK